MEKLLRNAQPKYSRDLKFSESQQPLPKDPIMKNFRKLQPIIKAAIATLRYT